ncbi:MAG: DEAD/DEAH box helicase family protein [Flavobacteriaceae bacterium]|nr:DEAD/DEAH box helicase family protein [Flavobacteriaceae bacterium]
MKEKVNIKVQGIKAFIDNVHLKPYFESKTTAYRRQYSGPNKGKMKWEVYNEKLYKSVPKKGFWVGIGALEWLNNHSEEIEFDIKEVVPKRGPITNSLIIRDDLKNNPKFKVNGKERFYFYEALEQCFKNPIGTVKLPTGSGKTPIQLTLADNQMKYIGAGMILVPTVTIKDQFISSAKNFGIELIDFYDLKDLKKGECFVTTHHIICEQLQNKEKKKEILKLLNKVDWIIVDECAHATCSSWFKILLNLENCQRCHGFSALPVAYETETGKTFHELDSDDARTIGILGSVIYEKSSSDLREFLNIPEVINVKYSWPEEHHELSTQAWDRKRFSKSWHTIRSAVEINNDRLEFIVTIMDYCISNGYKIATFVNSKKYANKILEMCYNKHIACWFGGGVAYTIDKTITPDYIKDNFGKEILGLILTSHGIEGLDFSNPLNVLLLHEGKSVRQTVQKVGRVVRPDDKPSIVINICDRGCNILPKHSNIRAGDIISEFSCKSTNCSTLSDLKENIKIIEENFKNA